MTLLRSLIAGLAFAIGIALCTGAFLSWRAHNDFAAQALHVDGVVTELSARTSAGGNSTVPIIQFKTPDGSIVHVSGPVDSDARHYAAGDHLPVLYDPLRPAQTRVDDAEAVWRQVTWQSAPGIPLVLIGGGLLLVQIRQQRRQMRGLPG